TIGSSPIKRPLQHISLHFCTNTHVRNIRWREDSYGAAVSGGNSLLRPCRHFLDPADKLNFNVRIRMNVWNGRNLVKCRESNRHLANSSLINLHVSIDGLQGMLRSSHSRQTNWNRLLTNADDSSIRHVAPETSKRHPYLHVSRLARLPRRQVKIDITISTWHYDVLRLKIAPRLIYQRKGVFNDSSSAIESDNPSIMYAVSPNNQAAISLRHCPDKNSSTAPDQHNRKNYCPPFHAHRLFFKVARMMPPAPMKQTPTTAAVLLRFRPPCI